jgi:23S rRNA (cytosine1962-C5)-methyltransferase
VYRKVFQKDRSAGSRPLEKVHSDAGPWIGSAVEPEIKVREDGLVFIVRPYDGYATGLFLDHRLNRKRIRELVSGRRLLNTFAYTCAYTVAAAAGDARETVSVDVSRKALEWGKRNLSANGLSPDGHLFSCSDVFDYFRRAERQGRRFDVVILDPPTFSRTRRPARVFALEQDLGRLVEGGLGLLDPGGRLLLCVNHRGTSFGQLEKAVRAAAAEVGHSIGRLERQPLPDDFRGDPGHAKSILVCLR